MINLKTQGELGTQLTRAINFFSSKDSKETRTVHSESKNIEIMIGNETDITIEELFDSPSQKYQRGLEEPIKGNEFVFDSVDLITINVIK